MGRSWSVLIADNDLEFRTQAAGVLRAHGYVVAEAAGADELLELSSSGHPDVVLYSTSLARGDAAALTRKLRSLLDDSILVGFSMKADIGTAVTVLQSGAHGFEVKPVSNDHLLLLCERSLQRLRLMREMRGAEEEARRSHPAAAS